MATSDRVDIDLDEDCVLVILDSQEEQVAGAKYLSPTDHSALAKQCPNPGQVPEGQIQEGHVPEGQAGDNNNDQPDDHGPNDGQHVGPAGGGGGGSGGDGEGGGDGEDGDDVDIADDDEEEEEAGESTNSSSGGPAQALDVPIAAPEPLVVGYAAEDDQFFDAPEQQAADAASVRTPSENGRWVSEATTAYARSQSDFEGHVSSSSGEAIEALSVVESSAPSTLSSLSSDSAAKNPEPSCSKSQKRPLPKKRKVESSKKQKLDVAISADTSGHDTSTTTTTMTTADMSGHETSDKSHNTSHDTSGDDVLHDVRRQGEEPEKEDKKERSGDGKPGKSEERPGGDPQQDPSTRCGQTEREVEEVPHSDFLWRDISQEDGSQFKTFRSFSLSQDDDYNLVSCIPPTQDDYIMPRIEPSSPTGPTVTFEPENDIVDGIDRNTNVAIKEIGHRCGDVPSVSPQRQGSSEPQQWQQLMSYASSSSDGKSTSGQEKPNQSPIICLENPSTEILVEKPCNRLVEPKNQGDSVEYMGMESPKGIAKACEDVSLADNTVMEDRLMSEPFPIVIPDSLAFSQSKEGEDHRFHIDRPTLDGMNADDYSEGAAWFKNAKPSSNQPTSSAHASNRFPDDMFDFSQDIDQGMKSHGKRKAQKQKSSASQQISSTKRYVHAKNRDKIASQDDQLPSQSDTTRTDILPILASESSMQTVAETADEGGNETLDYHYTGLKLTDVPIGEPADSSQNIETSTVVEVAKNSQQGALVSNSASAVRYSNLRDVPSGFLSQPVGRRSTLEGIASPVSTTSVALRRMPTERIDRGMQSSSGDTGSLGEIMYVTTKITTVTREITTISQELISGKLTNRKPIFNRKTEIISQETEQYQELLSPISDSRRSFRSVSSGDLADISGSKSDSTRKSSISRISNITGHDTSPSMLNHSDAAPDSANDGDGQIRHSQTGSKSISNEATRNMLHSPLETSDHRIEDAVPGGDDRKSSDSRPPSILLFSSDNDVEKETTDKINLHSTVVRHELEKSSSTTFANVSKDRLSSEKSDSDSTTLREQTTILQNKTLVNQPSSSSLSDPVFKSPSIPPSGSKRRSSRSSSGSDASRRSSSGLSALLGSLPVPTSQSGRESSDGDIIPPTISPPGNVTNLKSMAAVTCDPEIRPPTTEQPVSSSGDRENPEIIPNPPTKDIPTKSPPGVISLPTSSRVSDCSSSSVIPGTDLSSGEQSKQTSANKRTRTKQQLEYENLTSEATSSSSKKVVQTANAVSIVQAAAVRTVSYMPRYLPRLVDGSANVLEPGLLVFAKWQDGHFYPGRVDKPTQDPDVWSITFDDGGKYNIPMTDVIICDLLPVESEVMAQKGNNKWGEPAIVVSHFKNALIVGYVLRFEDGSESSIKRRSVTMNQTQAAKLIEGIEISPSLTRTTFTPEVSLDNLLDGKRKRPPPSAAVGIPGTPTSSADSNKSSAVKGRKLSASKSSSTSKKQKLMTSTPRVRRKNIPVESEDHSEASKSSEVKKVLNPCPPVIDSPRQLTRTPRKNKMVLPDEDLKGPIPPEGSMLFDGMTFLLTHIPKSAEQREAEQRMMEGTAGGSTSESDSTVQNSFITSLSQNPIVFNKDHIRKQITGGGGRILEKFDLEELQSAKSCFLITDMYQRTLKYFGALAFGIPCMSHIWIRNSCQNNKLENYKEYLLPAGYSIEKKMVVECSVSTLPKDLTIVLSIQDVDTMAIWREILKAACIHVHTEFPPKSSAYKVDRFWPGNEKYMKETIEGLISINIARPPKSFHQFEKRLRHFVANVLPKDSNFTDLKAEDRNLTLGPELSIYSGLIFDAILMLGKAIRNLTRNGENLNVHREDIAPFFHKYSTAHRIGMKTEQQDGATGTFFLNKHKDRVTDYAVEIVNNAELLPMFTYYFTEYINNPQKNIKLKPVNGSYKWPGNQFERPSGFPVCGGKRGSWDNPSCSELSGDLTITQFFQKNKYYFIGVLIFILIVVMFFLLRYLWLKIKETEQKSIEHWLIKWRDIITEAKKDKCDDTIRKILYSQAEKPKIVHGIIEKEFFAQVAFFKGLVVCTTHVDCPIDKTSAKFINEMKLMRNLRHENLNQFLGVCPTPPYQCIVTLYAKYGSLCNVIADEQHKITPEFKLSFLIDTSSGMEYLHATNLGHHGHFSSNNVVIDSKWTCKITDFGMSSLQTWKSKTIRPADMLYQPPEILRLQVEELDLQTKQQLQLADIYAFGIVMQELALRSVPFAMERQKKPLVEVISKLSMVKPTVPYRPKIPKGTVSPAWLHIMTQCWHEDPNERPAFKQVSQAIRRIAKGKTIYIIDIMLEKLEKHTVKMEKLVAMRKRELNEKQQEVEKVLFNILPESTARSLLKKNFVEPEYFESATIYFSDLVGFTKICQNSTPYQVVAFLNAAYSVFDDVTDRYNVYKCETIRDVYMVASGLPKLNLKEHASEAATMALHLLSTVTTFKIPHRPADTLQLRIGLHSGSVVTGIVGIKMPHYCLFGDTINTASRMQTSGYALQIHISSTTAELLQKTNNFFLDMRGEMQIKGKGLMTTFWLRGKRGFRQPLPDLKLAAPLEDHYFK